MNTTATVTPQDLQAVRQAAPGIPLDDAMIAQHQMTPPNIEGVHSYRGLDEEPELKRAPTTPPHDSKAPPKHLDVNAFGQALHNELKNEVVGYQMCMRQAGKLIYNLQWNWSQMPVDGSHGWNPDIQMHVASVSKLITAMAMTRALDAHGISYDAKIINHLPTYWAKGPNIDKVTFRHLMTHTSGFSAGGATDFATMKQKVAQGVAAVGSYAYENMNFGLCRILIATVSGAVNKAAVFPDPVWDLVSVSAYASCVHATVLNPAGASGATLDHPAGCALAYNFPPVGKGWNSGTLGSVSGGAGWHFSATQLLDVMSAFRRKGTIMSVAKAQAMLDNGFGIDVIANTPAGRLYNKNGRWTDGSNRTEQALAYFLPEDREMVVFANSPLSAQSKFFRGVVTDLYNAHLV